MRKLRLSDLEASEIVFEADGAEYQFTPPSTSVGVLALMVGHGDELASTSRLLHWVASRTFPDDIVDRVHDDDDPLDLDTVISIATWLLGEVAGRYHYVATRLLMVAVHEWDSFNGWCRAAGIKPLELSTADLCDVIYHRITDQADEKARAKIHSQLLMPPAGAEVEDDHPMFSPEAELAAAEASPFLVK